LIEITSIKIHIYTPYWGWQVLIADGTHQEKQMIRDFRAMLLFRGIKVYHTCTHSALTNPPYHGVRAVLATTRGEEEVKELFAERFGYPPQRVKVRKSRTWIIDKITRCGLGAKTS